MPQSGQPLAFIVLAAGLGSRLNGAIAGRPKWLIDIDEHHTIADNQLAGLDSICSADSPRLVVTGESSEVVDAFQAQRVVQGKSGFQTCFNERFREWNNWYSLVVGLLELERIGWTGSTVIVNGDLYCPQDWFSGLAAAVNEDSEMFMAIDASRPLTDEAMKVEVANGHVTKVGKVGLDAPTGEYLGLAVLDSSARSKMLEASKVLEATRQQDWYEGAVQVALDNGLSAAAWVTPALPWVEVDNEEDLATARSMIHA